MLTIEVTGETSAPPDRVLEEGTDFSEWRAEVWPNVTTKRLEVHELGDTVADVTEGTWVVGVFWERCRYDWSQPGSVKATVIDSNVFEPGSTWELRATPREGGSSVEMIVIRGFRKGPKGRIASAVWHTFGTPSLRHFLRTSLAAVEKRSASN